MSEKTTDLGKGQVGKLLIQLALPAIVAQIVNVLYNIVDRIYIGRLPDSNAMAGVGIAFPVIIIVGAFSALLGMGGAPLAAIKMGQKDQEGAERIISNSFSMLIIVGIVLMSVLLIFQEPILWAFGASEATIAYAKDYLFIYLLGTVAVQIALGMNPFINTQGFAKIGMCTVLLGAITNIILDPIFIFTFKMGVKGAALATILAQIASAAWVVYFFLGKERQFKNSLLDELIGKKTILKIRKAYLKPDKTIVFKIMSLGVSPFIMQSTESLVLISLNNQLLFYGNQTGEGIGNLAITSMTIMSSIMQMITLPMIGLAQGAQPIISFNYGAKNYDRVKKTFKLLLASCLTYTGVMWILIMTMPQVLVRLFNGNPEVIQMTTWSMKIYFGGVLLMGAQMGCQQTFLALGQAKISLFLALLRKVILLIPLIFILPHFIENQLAGVLIAEPVADITAALTTLISFMIFYKKTFPKDTSQ